MPASEKRRAEREALTEFAFGFVIAWYCAIPSVPWGDKASSQPVEQRTAKINAPPTSATATANIPIGADWKAQIRVWGENKTAVSGVGIFIALGGFMAQVNEYFGALVCWAFALAILLTLLSKSQFSSKLRMLGHFVLLAIFAIVVRWTVIKVGDGSWSAFQREKTPEQIAITIEKWLKPRTVVHTPKLQYYFKLTVPDICGEEVEVYMLNAKDSSHDVGIRRRVIGSPEERAFVDSLPPKLQRQLVYRLQIELARVNPTFYWVVEPTEMAIVSFVPIDSSFNREQLNTKLNELDSLTLILQRTLILWEEDHGYEDTRGYVRFQNVPRRPR
jgi:hypothetical protein